MKKFSSIGLLIFAIIGMGISQPAQARPTVSLMEMPCLTTSAASGSKSFISTRGYVSIGSEVFTSIASLFNNSDFMGSDYIRSNIPAGVACRITPGGSKPRFRTLRLAFGINNRNEYVQNSSLIKLTITLDGNDIGSKEITKGDKQYWLVNVTNVRSVALKGECLSGQLCPSLTFVQTLLEE